MLTDKGKSILQDALRGNVLLPETAAYSAACHVWNAMIERRPAAIVPCRTTQQVQAALHAARVDGLAVSIRGGGHNIAGTAIADGALMIDLSGMRGVNVDATQRLAHVEGGATWADVDSAAQMHGLAVPGGAVSSTGVAGLTLGGGFGWLARRYGLAADNLLSVQIVLADGTEVTATAESHTDLFWAVRGGGGNFGVATGFTFRMHPVGPQVLFGPTFFALEDAGTVLRAYATHAPGLTRDGCVWANLMTAPPSPALPGSVHGTKVLNLMQFHLNRNGEGAGALAALYGGVMPLGSALAPRPFTEAQQFLDDAYESGARNYWRAHNHVDITSDLIDMLVEMAPHLPTPESELLICHLGGAISDVAESDTAFPHRQIPFVTTPGVRWRDAAEDNAMTDWLRQASRRIAEHAVPGAYVNFIAEREGRTADAYGTNLARLSRIKKRYDPDNIFRVNQNVPPEIMPVI